MRGGLDDALDKLARRDELRRRTAGEAPGTPPAVNELVEAIAAVVGRNPKLEVTVGVEGAGDPMLLHFAMEDGVVQVSADTNVSARPAEPEPTAARHADFDIVDVEEPPAYSPPPAPAYESRPEAGQETRRISYDDRDRYDPGTGYATSAEYARNDAFFSDAPQPEPSYPGSYAESGFDRGFGENKYGFDTYSENTFDGYEAQERAAQERSRQYEAPSAHPFAATPPPPVPPQATRRVHVDQHRAVEEPIEQPQDGPRGMPEPLPEPIPLRIDSEATEAASRRLAALLRDNPTLLRQSPQD